MSIADVYNLLGRGARLLEPGPVFTRDLRVTSRRGRYYALRLAYVVSMAIVVSLYWTRLRLVGTAYRGYTAAYMAEAGRNIVSGVAWFQFVSAQFLAMVLLSNAISSELSQRTLGVLMTTPISSFKIVVGKLLSNLWHVLLLLAISLPMLAVVRVLGGIPWGFVVASLSVTVTAALLVGAVSLFFSVGRLHPLRVMFRVVAVYGSVVGVVLVWAAFVWDGFAMSLPPVLMMGLSETFSAVTPRSVGLVAYWPAHCAAMLALTALVLLAASRRVRRVGMEAVAGGKPGGAQPPPARKTTRKPSPAELRKTIRRVGGSPLVWKELRFYLPAGRTGTVFVSLVFVLVLASSYAGISAGNMLDYAPVHVIYAMLYFWSGIIVAMVLAAGAITAERRSGTLELLLTTPLTDGQIVFAKGVGVLRQALPAWLFLLLHMFIFTALGRIHPVAVLLLTATTVSTAVFVTGVGLYWSTSLKSATSAIVATITTALLWWTAPVFLISAADAGPSPFPGKYIEIVTAATPMAQIVLVVRESVITGRSEAADGLSGTSMSMREMALVMGISFAVHVAAGLWMGRRARTMLRRKLFR